MIKDNLNDIRQQINEACVKANRLPEEVTLIAVSKTKPISMLEEVYHCGCRHFGENKVQELVEKYEALPKDIVWHMIGHLQTNKVKYIIDKVSYIHSVDSIRLAQVISNEAKKRNVTMNIFIEVNIAMEQSKFGVLKEDAFALVKEISQLPNIKIVGLMAIAPYVVNSEDNRQYFVNLRELCVDIRNKNLDNVTMNELSFGMSGDYLVAISEGSTFVRVGTSIFGNRK